MSKSPLIAAGVCGLALGVAACGGSSSSSSSAAAGSSSSASSSSAPASSSGSSGYSKAPASASASGGTGSSSASIAAEPNGQLAFTEKTLTAKAGTVTINFTNKAPEGHNFTLQQGTSGPIVGATPTFKGSTKTLSVKLKPGTYTFFCTVPGHRAGGMQGTLTVS